MEEEDRQDVPLADGRENARQHEAVLDMDRLLVIEDVPEADSDRDGVASAGGSSDSDGGPDAGDGERGSDSLVDENLEAGDEQRPGFLGRWAAASRRAFASRPGGFLPLNSVDENSGAPPPSQTSRVHALEEGTRVQAAPAAASDAPSSPPPPPVPTRPSGEAPAAQPVPTDGSGGVPPTPYDRAVTEMPFMHVWGSSQVALGLIFAVLFVLEHIRGILVVHLLTATLISLNDVVRGEVRNGRERSLRNLGLVAFAATICAAVCYGLSYDEQPWRMFTFQLKDTSMEFWDVVFIVIVNDFVQRLLLGVVLKTVILALGWRLTTRKRGQILALVEILHTFSRSLFVCLPWFVYLGAHFPSTSRTGPVMQAVYFGMKIFLLWEMLRAEIVPILHALFSNRAPFGRAYATAAEAHEAGPCAICQEEPMAEPVALECEHVMCEACLRQWFARDKTCPLCRASVECVDWETTGDGSTSLLVMVF